jgi:enolase
MTPACTAIDAVFAWETLDSRGNPTVACEVRLRGGATGSASVPAGASTGSHEARELRDGGQRYGGRGVGRAVANVRGELSRAVLDMDAADQQAVDGRLREADGTADLGRLGANAVLAVSLASALASAEAAGVPLWRRLCDEPPLLPMPMVNILSGGAHAAGALDIQDCLAIPVGASSFAEAVEWTWRVRRATAALAAGEGLPADLVADEGGLGLPLRDNRAALELVSRGIEAAGLKPGEQVCLAVDVAATQFQQPAGSYLLAREGRELTTHELTEEIASWAREFPLVSVEDPLAEEDWAGWRELTRRVNGVQLLGDDLFVTDPVRLQRGVAEGVANAVLVKPNQSGTLTGAREVVRQAQAAGYATVVSARSGETEDSWLADLAVGWRAGQIKVGSTTRSERTAKWNRLLRIEAQEAGARFAGRTVLAGG